MSHEKPTPVALNPEQVTNAASRMVHDAALLRGGVHGQEFTGEPASLFSDGSISPTSEQMRRMYETEIIGPLRREFEKSPEARAAATRGYELNELRGELNGLIRGWAMHRRPGKAIPGPQVGEQYQGAAITFARRYADFVDRNELRGIDLPALDRAMRDSNSLDVSRVQAAEDVAQAATAQIEVYRGAIAATKEHLFRFSDYRIDNTVQVARSRRNPGDKLVVEDGWRVTGMLANGSLVVESPDGGFWKPASIQSLDAVNGTPRTLAVPELNAENS